MGTTNKDNTPWFKNIKKNDSGYDVDILPMNDSVPEKIVIKSSSNYGNNTVMNVADRNPQTKWVSDYKMVIYKDDFYTNKNVSTDGYSRGKIVDDGKNKKIVNDNQDSINKLRNKIYSLNKERDNTIWNVERSRIEIEPEEPKKYQSDFKTYTNIHIGNSDRNIKQVPINNNDYMLENSNISNRYGDNFNIWIRNVLVVRRIDSAGGWGDSTVGTMMINGNGQEQYVHIGESHTNTIGIPLPDRKLRVKSNHLNLSWSSDRFYIYVQPFIYVQRTDDSGGWGDGGLHVRVYTPDINGYQKHVNERDRKNLLRKKKMEYNESTYRTIEEIKRSYDDKVAALNTQITNMPKIDVNNLPVSVTDDGKYIGNKQTTLTNNSVIKGEWIDVTIPNTITVNRYRLLPGRRDDNSEQLTPFPKDFYLLGSNDTNKWEIIDSHFDYTPTYSDNNTPITFDINNKKKYTHIRLVIAGLNPAYTDFKGLGAVSLSIFHLSGNRCYSINKSSCETFQSYINNNNMSNIEGLTMMDEIRNVLADLKDFNKKYSKYIKCRDITLSDNIRQDCTSEDNFSSVNQAYSKLMDNGSIQRLQTTPLNKYYTVDQYEAAKKDILQKHSEIIPLRQELDEKLKILNDFKNSYLADYDTNYDNTMYISLGLSVVLTSTLYFVFKQL
jgi:hypothetical protein